MRPSPEVQSDPTGDSTTGSDPRKPPSESEQLHLRFFAVIRGYTSTPPERALWRELLDTAIATMTSFTVRGRSVAATLVHHVGLALYFEADAAGKIALAQRRLAKRCRRPQASIARALAVLERIHVIQRHRTSRREAEIIALNLGGLSWRAIRARAKDCRTASKTPELPFGSASDGTRPSLSDGTRPSPSAVRTVLREQDLPAAASEYRGGGDRNASERPDAQQQQQNLLPQTTKPAANERTSAGTKKSAITETTDERARKRFEGLVATIATRTRVAGGNFTNEDEQGIVDRFAAGDLTLGDLQRRADEFRGALKVSGHAPQPVRRRHPGHRPDLSDTEYLVWEASGGDPAAVRRYREQEDDGDR